MISPDVASSACYLVSIPCFLDSLELSHSDFLPCSSASIGARGSADEVSGVFSGNSTPLLASSATRLPVFSACWGLLIEFRLLFFDSPLSCKKAHHLTQTTLKVALVSLDELR